MRSLSLSQSLSLSARELRVLTLHTVHAGEFFDAHWAKWTALVDDTDADADALAPRSAKCDLCRTDVDLSVRARSRSASLPLPLPECG